MRFSDGTSYLITRVIGPDDKFMFLRMEFDAEGKGVETGKTTRLRTLKYMSDAMGLRNAHRIMDAILENDLNMRVVVDDKGVHMKRAVGPKPMYKLPLVEGASFYKGTPFDREDV